MMYLPIALTILEIFYLFHMFFLFKTTYNFSTVFQDHMTWKYGGYILDHRTGTYGNRICILGKILAIVTCIFFIVRIILIIEKPEYNNILLYTTFWCLFGSLIMAYILNFNSLIYLIPLVFVELYFINYLDTCLIK